MGIEEIKTSKLKKTILIILLIFATLLIILGLNNSVSAVSIKSIGGRLYLDY
ncbi:MAG: hypothetical protein Q4G09_04420 [Clostridia bacterium]|nr:hypothetical protein [Clostridia bacterium]